MPVHDASGSNQNERLPPPRPERSQRNPEQLVQGSQSSARPLCVQSEQLPTESQVFKDQVLAGAKRADDPPKEMPERHTHGKNSIGSIRIQLFCQVIHFAGVRPFGEALVGSLSLRPGDLLPSLKMAFVGRLHRLRYPPPMRPKLRDF